MTSRQPTMVGMNKTRVHWASGIIASDHGQKTGKGAERIFSVRLGAMVLAVFLLLVAVPLWAEEAGWTEDGGGLRADRMLASILRSAPTGIGVVEHRVFVEVNDYILDLTGYTREELIGQNARMLYPTQEDFDYVGREKYRQITEKGTGSVETRWLHKDGSIRHVILSSTPLDSADLSVGVTFTVLDITERKQSEERFAKAFGSSPAPLVVSEIETGQFIDVNERWLEMLGYSREELIGRTSREVGIWADPNERDRLVGKISDQGSFKDQPIRFFAKSGNVISALWSAEVITLEGREVLLSLIHDETERKMAEAELVARTRVFMAALAGLIAVLLALIAWLVVTLRQRTSTMANLKESQESLATTLQSIGDGVIATDNLGLVINMNPVAERLCGWPLVEAKGKPLAEVFKIVNAQTRESAMDPVRMVLDSGKVLGLANHTALLSRDGLEYQVADSAAPIRDAAGNTTGVVLVFSDVTEKYAQAEKLRRSEELYTEMSRQVPGVLFQFYASADGKFGLHYISDQSEYFFGLKAEPEVFFERFTAMIVPEQREAFLSSIHKAVSECGNWYFEGMINKPTGEQIWFSGNSIPSRQDGEIVFNGFLLDITERKQAEQEAEESRFLLQSVLDTIPVRVFWKDLNLRYLGCNRPFANDAGRNTPSELIGMDDYQMGWLDQAELYREDDRVVIESKAPKLNFEEPQTTPDGKTIFLRTSKIPLRNTQGQIVGVLGTYEDITDRRRAEEEKLEMSRAAGRAEVATGVLHNVGNVLNSVNVSCTLLLDQLRQSRVGNVAKVAEMLAQPEGGLARFLTEDPRGQNIPAYLASLARALQEEQELMSREAEALQSRIGHIKEIVSMQQTYGRVSGAQERLSPEQLLEDALKFNAEALVRHGVTVLREYEAVPQISVDKHKVLQILLNLINNAKYACTVGDDQDKIITLRLSRPASDRLLIQVADNGMGITSENLTRIFQHGFTTRKDGHGFGLHSGALAARELGGSLTVHSDGPGLGATFSLELPTGQVATS